MTNEDRQTVTQREAFEAWAQTQLISTARGSMRSYVHGDTELAWDAWQAATLAERERCAKVCERERMVRGGEVFAADIRRGT